VAAAAFCLVGAFVAFSLRWAELCQGAERIPRRAVFAYRMIGYMANALLPVRPGDVLRVMLLRQRHGVLAVPALASVVLEYLIDLAVVLLLGLMIAAAVELSPAIRTGMGVGLLAGLAAVATLVMAASTSSLRLPLPRFLSIRLEQLRGALSALRETRRVFLAVAGSIVGWALMCLASVILLRAVQIPAPWFAAPLALVVTTLGSAIPSSPGAVGVYHFLVVVTLALFGIDAERALAYAILLHSVAIGLHVSFGFAAMSALGLDRRWMGSASTAGDRAVLNDTAA
jgi:glycosyltransferase 2 family protein